MLNTIRNLSLCCLSFLFAWPVRAADASGVSYAERPEVKAFIGEMQQKHGVPESWLAGMFATTDFKPAVIKLILPPVDPQVRSWKNYRARFVEPKRIAAGLQFWQENNQRIQAASEKYSVAPEIIVAIIGVETVYGKNMGTFETFSALTTLAFDYPPRAALFREQLEELILLAQEDGRHPKSYVGSYAGALGLPQFLPGSIRRFAVDFSEDGRIDLNEADDAIGSVARFLSEHGWIKDAPITVRAEIGDQAAAPLVALGVLPQKLPSEMPGLNNPDAPARPAALHEFVSPGQATEYWLGYKNFYVITRYNRSSFYAMAVNDLAAVLKQRRSENTP